jgi:predicted AlkP superfamily phosphohydrolase/phosphomutase
MSEERSRFKIKKGDVEVEYEGKSSDVDKRYEEAFIWVSSAATTSPLVPQEGQKAGMDLGKMDRRGGVRSNVVSKAVDKLIEEHWIKSKKIPDIVVELQRRAVPGVVEKTVRNALNRRVGKTLDRIKDNDGQWVYLEREKV